MFSLTECTKEAYSPQAGFQQSITSMGYCGYPGGVARILGKGVLMYAHAKRTRKFWLMPTYEMERNYHRERVLNVASELESRFRPNFGITFWLSSKLYFKSSWWFGVAKGVLVKAVLWTMLTRPRAEGGVLEPPEHPPGYATVDTDTDTNSVVRSTTVSLQDSRCSFLLLAIFFLPVTMIAKTEMWTYN